MPPEPRQDEEQWYFVATYSEGQQYTSPLTDDVASDVDYSETIIQNVTFDRDVVSMELRHKYYGILDNDEDWHSVIPLCINFSHGN